MSNRARRAPNFKKEDRRGQGPAVAHLLFHLESKVLLWAPFYSFGFFSFPSSVYPGLAQLS